MAKHLKPREQGDIGELSAMAWFAEQGAQIYAPLGHSPDVDFVASFDGECVRVEVKTGTYRQPNGIWQIQIATLGGNQSWSGRVKYFDPRRCDALFVHVGDGRRWMIPASEIEATSCLSLGGKKYSAFEVESGSPLKARSGCIESPLARGSFGVGEPSEPVKFVALREWVRIPPPPLSNSSYRLRGDRPVITRGTTTVSRRRFTTIPRNAFDAAGLNVGDRLLYEAMGDGVLRVTRAEDLGETTSERLSPQRRVDVAEADT